MKLKRTILKNELTDQRELEFKYGHDFVETSEKIVVKIGSLKEGDFVCDYEIVNHIKLMNTIITTLQSELLCISVYDLVGILGPADVNI